MQLSYKKFYTVVENYGSSIKFSNFNAVVLSLILRIICRVAWCGSGFDSENEPHVVVKTLTCGYAVKSSELVYTTKLHGNEPTFLKSAVRM